MLHVLRRVLIRSSSITNTPTSTVFSVSYNKESKAPPDDDEFTRLRGTSDHTLPGLTQLRKVCQKIIRSGVTDPGLATRQMKDEVGPCVAMGRFVINLDHPQLLTTIEQLQESGYSLHQILADPALLNKTAKEEYISTARTVDQPWLDRLAEKLGTTGDDLLHRAPKKMNAFYPRSQEAYLEKIDVLLDAGASQDDILDCLSILNRSFASLKKRCEEVRELGLAETSLPLKLINQSSSNYLAMIRYRKQTMELLGSHADSWHCLAQKLDTTPELVKQRLKPFDLVGTMQKIDVLLEMGLTRDDIILRPRLVNFSLANILRAKLVIDDHGMELSSGSLSYFLEKNTFPSKKNKLSMMEALCVLLNCSMADLRDHFQYIDKALTSTISSIEKSIRTLVSRDITLAEICACPLVLNYDSEMIEQAFGDTDIVPLDQWTSKMHLLNALVYTMDRYEPREVVEDDSTEDFLGEVRELVEAEENISDFELSEEELIAEASWSPPPRLANYGFMY